MDIRLGKFQDKVNEHAKENDPAVPWFEEVGGICPVCNKSLCDLHYLIHVKQCVEEHLGEETNKDEDGWVRNGSELKESHIEAMLKPQRKHFFVENLLEIEDEVSNEEEFTGTVERIQQMNSQHQKQEAEEEFL